MRKKETTNWHGRLNDKIHSMFIDGLVLRYDPRLRSHEMVIWKKTNVYLHIRLSEKSLEDFALSSNFDTDAFQHDSKLTMLQWSHLSFLERFTAIVNFVGLDRIPKDEERVIDAQTVCKILRIKYNPDLRFC